jgi:hypothetical protein
MEQDKINELVKKFPKLLKSVTCGIYCGEGWFDLVTCLCDAIESHINGMPENDQKDFYCVQIKEKFGSLRFYMNKSDDYISAMINIAESKSAKICEKCGKPGAIRDGSWFRCLCDSCQ